MSTRAKKFIGEKFGRLTIIDRDGKFAICTCDCGNTKTVQMANISHGTTRSCGCARYKEIGAQVPLNIKEKVGSNAGRPRLPLTAEEQCLRSRILKIRNAIMGRCYNPEHESYKHYGGRGITICDAWKTPAGFLEWAVKEYAPGLTIDRVNNDGNYEPDNCRWASRRTQANNRRSNILVFNWGERTTLAELISRYGLCTRSTYFKYQRILKTGRQPCEWDFNPKFPKRLKS